MLITEQKYYDELDGIEKTCGNCRHYDWQGSISIPLYSSGNKAAYVKAAPCKVNGNEADTPHTFALMSPDATCEDGFEPSAEAIAEAIESAQPIHVRYGITPGIDCPL